MCNNIVIIKNDQDCVRGEKTLDTSKQLRCI